MPRLESPCRQYRVVRWFLLPEGELQLRQATVGSGLQIHRNCGGMTGGAESAENQREDCLAGVASGQGETSGTGAPSLATSTVVLPSSPMDAVTEMCEAPAWTAFLTRFTRICDIWSSSA